MPSLGSRSELAARKLVWLEPVREREGREVAGEVAGDRSHRALRANVSGGLV